MPTDADLPATSLSIWPYATSKAPDSVPERDFRRLRCFILCPFKRAGTVFPIVEAAAETVEKVIGDDHDIEVYYAGDLTGSSAIHPDIWTHVAQAGIIVADITDYNPNVLYELGVAAAWRPQSTVIILRDRCDGRAEAFDLSPARQIIYESSSRHWMQFLSNQLVRNMLTGLASVPFTGEPEVIDAEAFEVALSNSKDTDCLWSPGPGHKRFLDDGLEFGSPHYFPYSWLSPPGWRPQSVRVAAEMRFSLRIDPCWVGIALRSQGYWAGNSYLTWLDEKGRVMRTAPGVDGRVKDEEQVGQLSEFDPSDDSFVPFIVSIDQQSWQISVANVQFNIPVAELPHVFPRGRILLQAYRCRGVVRNVKVKALE